MSRDARRDLIDVGTFTRDRWGAQKAGDSLRQMDRRLKVLLRNPKSGRVCGNIKPGYWRATEGRHVIFYVFSDKTLDVIRVLHERMLPERHLL